MCLACEQDAIWLAYLESRGLLQPDDAAAVEALFGAFPVNPLPVQRPPDAQAANGPGAAAERNPFSCDDPTGQ
jgi:hypothetical protein